MALKAIAILSFKKEVKSMEAKDEFKKFKEELVERGDFRALTKAYLNGVLDPDFGISPHLFRQAVNEALDKIIEGRGVLLVLHEKSGG